MAVFEKKKATKVNLDDTVSLTCVIEAAQAISSHIDYVVRVQRGPVPENSWQINKRYSDFDALNSDLKVHVPNLDLPLPPKKLFGNMEREFVAERQRGLQHYLNTLLANPMLASSLIVKQFLDPTKYSANLQEIALQRVSMFFRSEPYWEVVEPLKDIGWRLRKHYFMVRPKDQPKVKQILAWTDYGPDKTMAEKDLSPAMKVLSTIQHPFIYPIVFSTANENGGFTIRMFHLTGTLKDFICKSKPKHSYLKKYCKPKSHMEFNLMNIKVYGRQILEALKFLHDKGIPYGHLSAGNVMLEGNTCRLLDIENALLGLPSALRPFYTQFKKIQTMECIDVYSFGHLLYEMTFGQPLMTSTMDHFPPAIPPTLKSVLESILTTESCKSGLLPSVADLLSNPLFSDVPAANLNSNEKPQLKVPSKLKEAIKKAKEDLEKRLKDEQKVISSYRRLSKAKAFHSTEEEKQKRKRSSKKRLSQQQLLGDAPSPTTPTTPTNGASTDDSPTSPQPKTIPDPSISPPPPPSAPSPPPVSNGSGQPPQRGALLGSIRGFAKTSLKKSEIDDKSMPKL